MRKTLLLPTILLLGVFVGCYWISAGATTGRHAIVFCQQGQIHTLDPAKMTYLQDIRVAEGLWEGLALNSELLPALGAPANTTNG